MSGSHHLPFRSRGRRRKKRTGWRAGLTGVLVGVLGIGAVAAGIMALRPGGGGESPRPTGAPAQRHVPASVAKPRTGPTLSISTPEGYGYALGAVRAGTAERPLPRGTPPPGGATYAYADYVLTNTRANEALLEFPADLFVKRTMVDRAARDRCMPQPGVPEDLCTLPAHSQVTGYLEGSGAPTIQDGDSLMPGGASYLVRIATDLPVRDGLAPSDIGLFVWNARFSSDRKGIEVAFP